MAPRIDFYVLKSADDRARLVYACRLVEKAWQQQMTICVTVDTPAAAEAFDSLLWTFDDHSFVPHAIAVDATAIAGLPPLTPVHVGSGVAVALASKHPVGRLILEAPFTSAADIGAAAFPYLPVRWLIKDSFHSDQRIATVRAPLLILHVEKDTVVPIRFGERLFALANEPKRMIRFPQGDHVNLEGQGVIKAAKDFLAD